MAELRNTKTLLAKLLATENITVQYRNAQTASFAPKTRVLTLPIWDNMSPELYDLLGGHEVGHALETPADGWHDAATSKYGPGFRSFLNVVEDARIERKIKDRFPGIRKSFVKGYQELVERGFFGVDMAEVNGMILIDRINIHFKLGAMAGVRFSETELPFIKKIDAAETWEQVVAVTQELYDYCRQEIQNSIERGKELRELLKNLPKDDQDYDMSEAGESIPDYEDEGDADAGEPGNSDDGEESDKTSEVKKAGAGGSGDEEGDDAEDVPDTASQVNEHASQQVTAAKEELAEIEKIEQRYGKQGSSVIEPVSVTDQNYQEKVKTLGETKNVTNSIMPSVKQMNTKDLVVTCKELAGNIANRNSPAYSPRFINDFEKRNANAIAYLVKEFEMRKKASEYRRVSVSDTGTIDTNMLHSYKFNDNIFRKMASVADGKNHGMVMIIDWSGSMQDNIVGTIEQLMVLTMFCRKINVPFDVYSFTTEYRGRSQWLQHRDRNELCFDSGFNMLQLLSSSMSNQAYRSQANDLLAIAEAYSIATDYKNNTYDRRLAASAMIAPGLGLGGTPLNASIAALSKIVADFKTKNRVDIVTTAILTDGEDNSGMELYNGGYYERVGPESSASVSYVVDADTKKSYRVKKTVTTTLLEILKDRTGTNLIGFYIAPKRRSTFDNLWRQYGNKADYTGCEKAFSEFKNEKVYGFKNVGYDEYYMIPGGADLDAEDETLDDLLGDAKATQSKLKNAFLKMNQGRLTNRVLLRKFIEQVA
jgi:hypothetical protein